MGKLKVLSLFSGIGAYEKSLARLGINYEQVGFCEKESDTARAYSLIHSVNESLNLGDITQLNEKEVPDCDLLVYSPPCQAFSRVGKELGFDDVRGILFFDALRIIKEKKPKYLLMENVKGLTQKKFENEFKEMLNALDRTGYNNNYSILNAKDYGIPQNRERVFVISIRKDIDKGYTFPNKVSVAKDINTLLEPDAQLPILHNIYGGFKEKKPRIFNEYSPTIRTSAGGGHIPSVCTSDESKIKKVIDGYRIRQLTPKECLMLMDFDLEDYEVLKGNGFSPTQIYRFAGNSIPVGILERILKNLFNTYL